MSDLICRKSMMRFQTPGMCSPHGGCGPSVLLDTDARYSNVSAGPAVPVNDWTDERKLALTTALKLVVAEEENANLKAENEKLLKLLTRMVDQHVPLTELEGVPGWSRVVELVEVTAQRDALKAECEGLRVDAGRYRFVVDCPIRTMVALGRKAHEADFDLSAECDRIMGKGERS